MDRSGEVAANGRLAVLAGRHPVALFLVVALGLSYALASLVVLAQRGIVPGGELPAMLGIDAERAASLAMLLRGLFPAAVFVTTLEGGRPALVVLFRRIFRWRIGLTWWLVVVVALPALTVALALLLGDTLRLSGAAVLGWEVVYVLVAFVLVNLWEEAAWAGFLQTRLERRHTFFMAALLTGVPFAAIHLPLRVINVATTLPELAQAFVLLLILGAVVRPLVGMVLRGSGDSIFAAGLVHTFFNRSNNIDGIAADLLSGPNRQLAALLATLLLTVIIGIAIRHKLTRAHRRALDEAHSQPMHGDSDLETRAGSAGLV